MRRKSSVVSGFSSTRIGRRPCSSGSRSEGLAMWNAPEAMNSTWSVFTGPCLVETVVPSISGSRSRCTPSRETSAPMRPPSEREQTLSISSRNTMPSFSTLRIASLHELVLVEQLVALLRHQDVVGLADVELARLGALAEGLAQHLVEVDHADLAAGDVEGRQLRAGFGHLDLDLLVVELVAPEPLAETPRAWRAAPRRRPARRARAPRRSSRPAPCTSRRLLSRIRPMPTSTRSRTMESTSRPT